MEKILGIDLGTNSIGWALRNTCLQGNQIEKFGVLTFKKGVGNGKTGEFSYAAERTKKRSTRRLNQSRKYRLWATLEHLITEGYCPLSIEDLNRWRYYSKEEANKINTGGRVYPIDNLAFDAWIKLDFDGDGKPDYKSPYQLRHELASVKMDFNKEENRFKLGRALYHIAQRRGFKSSRKGVDETKEKEFNDNEAIDLQYSEKKKNKVITDYFTNELYKDAKTIGSLFALLENDNVRIRENITQYAIRENFKDEIKYIFQKVQDLGFDHPIYKKLVETGNNKNDGRIFYRRPLRSQKGLIGRCTLEPSKFRSPISHPSYETFRAWSFLNNIKYKDKNDNNSYWKQLPLELRQEIFQKKFFRKKTYFPFSEIVDFVNDKSRNWLLNYNPKTTVTGCPVSGRLKEIFGEDYLNLKIEKQEFTKLSKNYYNIEDIWHVLFNYEDLEYVREFAENKLKLDEEKTKQFIIAWNILPVGYGMLSINAINKINNFLEKGLIYTEAVLLANISKIVGIKLWQENESLLVKEISNVIAENRHQKILLNIVNNLIAKHKNLEINEKFGYKDNNYKLLESDLNDIQSMIEEVFGPKRWKEILKDEQLNIFSTIKECYQYYFISTGQKRRDIEGKRHFEIQISGNKYYKSDSGYYRLPRLIDTLSEFLISNFNILDKSLDKIYHPSEINIYPPAKAEKDGIIKLGSPKTGSFKNPMAMRTLHELRKLINYMIETNQIDNETRIVVEIARELNDSNKRWAIETWQRQREAENQEFSKAIELLLIDNKNIKANPQNKNDIDKLRLFYEQGDNEVLPPLIDSKYDNVKKSNIQKDSSIRWGGLGKKLIDKYRLWVEQGYQCLYTGRIIKLTDLFNENVIDFEHTIPRSISFDNSLSNLTLCYSDFNRNVKRKQYPTQLPNYENDTNEHTAILPRLEKWKLKIERIKLQIDFWKTKSKKAADKKWKDDAIQQRHLWQMELEYWQKKIETFTITEITTGFKNSQKTDTQLISKYAFHYLRSYFEKVDVQKGTITASFRKILKLQPPDLKKDRSKHSHHAKDAAVLTLIPVSVKRDEILKNHFESIEKNIEFNYIPYKEFKREYIWNIDDTILINNITNDQSLTPSKRKIRKKSKEQPNSGVQKTIWATGDSIRGQLHKETFYGAIKPAKKDEYGVFMRDKNGKYIQEEKVRYVERVPFKYKSNNADAGFKTLDEIKKLIVDDGLKQQIEKQVNLAGGLKEAFDKGIYLLDKNNNPHGNKIRHIRVWSNISEPLSIKEQTYKSKNEYKNQYLVANATNSYFAIYKTEDKSEFDYRNLYEVAKVLSINSINSPSELFEPLKISTYKKKKVELPLVYVLSEGLKVIFKTSPFEKLEQLNSKELIKRLYVFTNFEKDGRLNFKFHLEARMKFDEIFKDSEIDFEYPKPTLRLSYSKYDFLVEGFDFKIRPDGEIIWLKTRRQFKLNSN